jgi:uncharacterized protein (TIGR03086 family)
VSIEDHKTLWPFFSEDVEKLERLIRRDLSAWDPTDDRFRWPEPPADLVELHRRSMAWAVSIVENVTPDQFDGPTPCPDWTVRDLMLHTVNLMVLNASTFTQDHDGLTFVDATTEDPLSHYRAATAAMQAALNDPAFWKMAIVVPAAMLPAGVQLTLNVTNQVAHGWDLAVATGQDPTIPADVAEPLAAFTERLFASSDLWRGAFGDAVPLDASASDAERFVALLGRDPALATLV